MSTFNGAWVLRRAISKDLAETSASLAAWREVQIEIERCDNAEQRVELGPRVTAFDSGNRLLSRSNKVGNSLLGEIAAHAYIANDCAKLLWGAGKLCHWPPIPHKA
jgi:hypothetical protein